MSFLFWLALAIWVGVDVFVTWKYTNSWFQVLSSVLFYPLIIWALHP